MKNLLRKSKPSPTATLVLIPLLLLSLCACGANGGTVYVPSQANKVPEILLKPTPAPKLPAGDVWRDSDLAKLTLNDERALEACNADKEKIKIILQSYEAGLKPQNP